MTELSTLRAWLATLDADHLQAVLEQHPMALAGARVRDLDEMASRLEHPATVSEALTHAPTPVLEVVEATGALGAAATVTRLAALLDQAGNDDQTHDEQVWRWLEVGASLALLWIDGEHLRLNPGVHQIVLHPLALGPPSRELLSGMTSDSLARVLSAWHHPAPPRKAERWAAAADLFVDFAAIRRVMATAPGGALETLNAHVAERLAGAHSIIIDALAETGPESPDDGYHFDATAYRERQLASRWAASAGLALGNAGAAYGYGSDLVELPSEVYLALAPASFRAPFHPAPPPLALVDVAAEQIDRASGAAAGQFLGTAMAILEAVARDGIAVRQSGGVGAREITRYAKMIGTDTATVRLTLTLAAMLDLIDPRGRSRLRTTAEFQTWRRRTPEQRVIDLLLAWMSPGVTATLERDADGNYLPALSDLDDGTGIPTGFLLVRLLVDNPGRAAVSAQDVAAQLTWSFPRTAAPPGSLDCLWNEAHLLGVLADGAASPFAVPLCQADDAGAGQVLARLLPAQSRQVLFGSDLTIVVPGSPDPEAVDLLDIVAHREAHGVANTWRVSEQSVRDALDAGYRIDDLTAALRSIAGGDLPQALDYLLRDVARRHGHLMVRPAAAVVTCTDPALLAEVVGTRRLRKLTMVLAAPTVALADAEVPVLLRELRAAGYLPVETDGDGVPTLKLRRVPAADSSGAAAPVDEESTQEPPDMDDDELDDLLRQLGASQRTAAPAEPETPADVARRLLAEGDPAQPTDLEVSIAAQNRRLSAAEVHELADAVATGRGVQISYLSQSGGETRRAVSDLAVLGPNLYGYCHLRQAERNFRLDRILAVAPLLS